MWKPDELIDVSCDLCGHHETELVIKRPDGLRAVECVRCGLCYIDPRPRDELIPRLYGEDYFKKDTESAELGYQEYSLPKYNECRVRTARNLLDCIRPGLPRWPRTALEVGCAVGDTCHVLATQGTFVVGLDISDYAIGLARETYPGLDFRVGDLTQLATDAHFEAIFAFHVIEHVVSPRAFVQAAGDHLESGGVLVLATPNYDCARRVGARRWLGFSKSFEHLYFLDPKTLTQYAEMVGLKPLYWMSGAGGGLSTSPIHVLKSCVRKVFAACGVLGAIRSVRIAAARQRPLLREGPSEHYLVGVFQKP